MREILKVLIERILIMSTPKWTVNDVPDQTGKVAIVTGANSGLGFETTRGLARKNATVIMACRDLKKGDAALEKIRREFPDAKVELMKLDLADLDSVRQFAENFKQHYSRLDLLINNAGIMAIPFRQTKQGFEMQFGTNHLGHFALTGLLLPLMLETPGGPRVVTTSSGMHMLGDLNFADLNWSKGYTPYKAYGRSKLANLLFTYELQRRLDAQSEKVLSVASHPGYAATNLQTARAIMEGKPFNEKMALLGNRLFAQSAEMGALPTLYAATAPEVKGGQYFGPGGLVGMRGYPKVVGSSKKSQNPELAAKLWAVSEEFTGVNYSKTPVGQL